MQGIITKYLGPTNTKGSRVKARSQAGSIVVNWEYSIGIEENHKRAAETLKGKLGWTGLLVSGALPNASEYAHCFTTLSAVISLKHKEASTL